jgi:hypothetical protein
VTLRRLILYFLVLATVPLIGAARADTFVFPVGDMDHRPKSPPAACPNPNGFRVSQGFDNSERHTGVDLCQCQPNCASGGEVRAIGRGEVTIAHTCGSPKGRCGEAQDRNFGNAILIRHELPGGPFYSLYAHMEDGSITVAREDPVEPGTPIGRVGSTGSSTAPHLHFAVKRENILRCGYIRREPCLTADSFDNYVDPLQFIEAFSGTPPVVEEVVFPPSIPGDGIPRFGHVGFSDPDGDIVFASFDVVSDTCGGCFTPFAFDPNVFGLTEGSFDFFMWCVGSFSWTLAVTLEDAQGNISDPHEFTTTCVGVGGTDFTREIPEEGGEPPSSLGGGGLQ